MALWWGPDNCGYRINLRLAGKYSGEQILEDPGYYNNENTQPILCEEAEELVEHQVNYNNFK